MVQLVGRPDVIEAELARHPDVDRSRLEIHEAADVIGMGEKPLAAVRKKPNSSLVVGLTLQKQGRSDAFVSAGNTGATLAASTVLLGLHDGVERATVATLFPTGREPVLVLDGGANVDCSAQRAGRLRLPRHRLHARHPRPAQARSSGCSTSARRRRRATRSCGRRTSSSSSRRG